MPVVPPNFNASYLENPAPAYPPLSRRVGEQGKVMLRVLVNTRGTADTVELRLSSGSSRLDDAAVESVRPALQCAPRHEPTPRPEPVT